MSTHSVPPIPARMERRPDGQPLADLLAYLRLLAGPAPRADERFDVRWRIEHGRMAQRFIPARRSQAAARLILRLAPRTDVYVGVALRQAGKGGGRAAIRGAHLLHIDLDHTDRQPSRQIGLPGRLASFALPTVEIASGTPGHRHLYFLLRHTITVPQVESANRRLAVHLDGDPVAVDVARILRPPSSLSHRHDPPRPVRLLAYREHARYTLTELTCRLPADPHPHVLRPAAVARREPRSELDRQLLAIPAVEYVRVLAGLTPDRAGKVACPLHEDAHPSLQLYEDGSWYCFGCRRGGTIYDFAAALTGSGTRGVEFLKLREQLAMTFGVHGDSVVARVGSPARRP